MKKFAQSFALFAVLATAACNQPKPAPAPAAITATEATSTQRGAENAPQDAKTKLARKWVQAERFLQLKLDGTFEGTIDEGVISVGKWTISDDEKTLTLNAEKNQEGKGASLAVSYQILSISDTNMKVKDANGKEFDFAAQ